MPANVLFLCTGNSARSILAEALLNDRGGGRYRAFSAGSHPKGQVHPLAIQTLEQQHVAVGSARSKSWDEFATADAVLMDVVITVCDNAAGEVCPVWPGHPVTAHWGIADPAAATGSEDERRRAFMDAFRELDTRIRAFARLPVDRLDAGALKRELSRLA